MIADFPKEHFLQVSYKSPSHLIYEKISFTFFSVDFFQLQGK